MYPDPASLIRVPSLGAGPIGGGWAAHFLARGYDVTAYVHAEAERPAFLAVLDTAWISRTAPGWWRTPLSASWRSGSIRSLPGPRDAPSWAR